MKTFIDPEENYIVEIPNDWYYTVAKSGNQPSTFEPYKDQESAFQISVKPQAENIPDKKVKTEPVGKNDLNLDDVELPNKSHSRVKGWYGLVGDKIVIITLTYNPKLDKNRIKSELKKAERSKRSFILLDKKSRKTILPEIRWNNLLLSHAASIDLSNRAFSNGSHLELVVLLANQIDSILRQSIILKQQITYQHDKIDVALIHQKDTDQPIFEKKVYQKAKGANIISEDIFQILNDLYKIRNKSIHRFIISDLRTDDIIQLVWSYSQLTKTLGQILRNIEQEQFTHQVGLFRGDTPPDSPVNSEMFNELISAIRDKHGNRRLNEDITVGK